MVTASVALVVVLVGFAFAGSQSALAAGTTIAGVDVGGLSERQAVRVLTARATVVEQTPVVFTAKGETFALSASQLGVAADWQVAVREAREAGGGIGPVRGFRRLHARFFGIQASPPVGAYDAAVNYKVDRIVQEVSRSGVDASLVRKGLGVQVVEGRSGRTLDHAAATAVILQSLGRLERGTPVALPLKATAPRVGAADLANAARKAHIALSAPIQLTYGETRWRVPRWKIASLLRLPVAGATTVTVAGRGAEEYLQLLSDSISRTPQDARFQVTATGKIAVRPSAPGLLLDIPATARAIAAAAFSADRRTASLTVRVAEAARTTEDAKKMGITGVVASYTTTYGGTPGRLNNVQVVAEMIDGTLIQPGGTFSFNGTTGERSVEKGFQEAPVIINGELKNGIGGGICQVSTTVFNAAFDSGLPITARANHALYISHYPLGRDATVNYPDLDLRFVNDTGHWLLLRTFVGAGSLTVNLYGTPVNRRVESTTEPLAVTGPVPVLEIDDPTLAKGKRVIDELGSPPRQTSVHRLVYDTNGTTLYDTTWRSFYVGEPSLVRVGSKKPVKKPVKKPTDPKNVPKDGTSPTTGIPGEGAATPEPATTLPARP